VPLGQTEVVAKSPIHGHVDNRRGKRLAKEQAIKSTATGGQMTIQEQAIGFATRTSEISQRLTKLRSEAEQLKKDAGDIAADVVAFSRKIMQEQPENAAPLVPVLDSLQKALMEITGTQIN
jgi:uncharacterized coiled-coil DUF342 family protein